MHSLETYRKLNEQATQRTQDQKPAQPQPVNPHPPVLPRQ